MSLRSACEPISGDWPGCRSAGEPVQKRREVGLGHGDEDAGTRAKALDGGVLVVVAGLAEVAAPREDDDRRAVGERGDDRAHAGMRDDDSRIAAAGAVVLGRELGDGLEMRRPVPCPVGDLAEDLRAAARPGAPLVHCLNQPVEGLVRADRQEDHRTAPR